MKRTVILWLLFFSFVLLGWGVLKFRRWQAEGRRMVAHFCGAMHGGKKS